MAKKKSKQNKTSNKSGGSGMSRFWERPDEVAPMNPLRRDDTETVMPEHRRPHEEHAAEVAKEIFGGDDD